MLLDPLGVSSSYDNDAIDLAFWGRGSATRNVFVSEMSAHLRAAWWVFLQGVYHETGSSLS